MTRLIRSIAVAPVLLSMMFSNAITLHAFPPLSASPESDPLEARSDAHKIASKFYGRGYTRITPLANGDNLVTFAKFDVNLPKGMDVVLMVGKDEALPDIDLYVESDSGSMIKTDTRPISRACVEFNAPYNGDYKIIVRLAPSAVIGHFAVLIGVRPSGYQ